VARILAGLPATGALPRAGTPERTRYQAQLRTVQRSIAPEGKQRRPFPRAQLPRVRDVLQQRATSARLDKLARTGARVRIRGQVVIPSPGRRVDSRTRTMPSGGPGVALTGEGVRAWARPLVAGDDEDAAAAFLDAFTDAYGIPPGTVLDDVEALTLWSDDEPEP